MKNLTTSYSSIVLFAIALLFFLIYSMPMVVIPIIISAIISIGVYPVHSYLISKKIPEVISALLIVLSMTIGISLILFFMSYEGTTLFEDVSLDKVPTAIEHSTENIENEISKNTPLPHFDLMSKAKSLLSELAAYIPDVLLKIKDMLVFIASCPIYILFMLLYHDNFKNAFDSFASKLTDSKKSTILEDIKKAYRSYIVGMFFVISIISTLTAIGLWIVGIPNPIFLGVLAGFLTVIPYLGVIISAFVPSLIAVLVLDSWWSLVGVLSVFAIVQFLEGNLITPKILGDKVNVNPISILLGMVFLGSIGGILAMVITVPLLSIVLILSKHSHRLKPLFELMKA